MSIYNISMSGLRSAIFVGFLLLFNTQAHAYGWSIVNDEPIPIQITLGKWNNCYVNSDGKGASGVTAIIPAGESYEFRFSHINQTGVSDVLGCDDIWGKFAVTFSPAPSLGTVTFNKIGFEFHPDHAKGNLMGSEYPNPFPGTLTQDGIEYTFTTAAGFVKSEAVGRWVSVLSGGTSDASVTLKSSFNVGGSDTTTVSSQTRQEISATLEAGISYGAGNLGGSVTSTNETINTNVSEIAKNYENASERSCDQVVDRETYDYNEMYQWQVGVTGQASATIATCTIACTKLGEPTFEPGSKEQVQSCQIKKYTDTDNDGAPDVCEAECQSFGLSEDYDDDNDGIADWDDKYPLIALIDIGEYVDTDKDGAPDECDNKCEFFGMKADTDDDNDGIADVNDAFPLFALGDLTDTNNDGRPDECDAACVSLGMTADTDDDSDGIADADDAYPLDPDKWLYEIVKVVTTDDRGTGSLREMLNTYPPGTTIIFDPSLSGATIVLDSGLVAEGEIIDASNLANGLTIDGNGNGPVFSTDGDVTFNSLTITGGSGEIGGGIDNSGNLTLLNSTLHDNSAVYGGGAIFNGGELKVVNSTFYNNRSLGYGGFGGAIYNNAGNLTLVNSTIVGNEGKFGGGIYHELGSPWFISLENTIVAGNTADVGADIYVYDENKIIKTSGHNLIGDNSSVASWFAEGELVGSAANPMDPMLGDFGDNAGPTYTMLPLTGSPLINSGISQENTPSVDQRGLLRISGLFIDIGAVELQQQGSDDNDSDGIADAIDPDDDNDSVLDNNDAYPLIAIGDYVDTDNDGAPDLCNAACISLGMAADTDDDNDGVLDVDDAYPLDVTQSKNTTQQKVKNDVDGDGNSDLLWRSEAKGWNFLWSMDGVKTKQAKPINVVQDDGWLMAGQGDYDADGHSDILWRNTLTGLNFIYLMDGLNIKAKQVLNYVDAPQWELRGSGDFNGDGKGDVLWRNVDRGDTWFYMMDGLSIGTNQPSLWVTDLNYKIAAIGDINGDGTDDVIWRNQVTGVNYIWIMQDGQIADRYTLNAIDADWTIAGAGDLDGDGTDDIILRNQVDGRNWAYLMEDGQIKTSELINTVGMGWQIADMGDYDGDGKADLLWRNESTARNIVHLMDGLTIKDKGVLRPTDNTWQLAK
ncbi:FG-GAP-like repeat-containing protein [Paraglaciecola sp. MB-3u-78]|uniref:FG-GAP-like repeat-containing protein n=1 Tax=Paraglaciecola sp. MB-3u-78 TaxID=2058332 RepID=UPI0012FF1E3E|nr:FG-GAP-like repeat-containing protein [Paraglaciecola sp. MB-3u-78]